MSEHSATAGRKNFLCGSCELGVGGGGGSGCNPLLSTVRVTLASSRLKMAMVKMLPGDDHVHLLYTVCVSHAQMFIFPVFLSRSVSRAHKLPLVRTSNKDPQQMMT